MFGGGFSFASVTPRSAAPGTITSANNGLSEDPSGNVVLGNNPGDASAPAQLLSNREIQANGFFIQLVNSVQNGIRFQFNPSVYALFWYDTINGDVGISNSAGSLQMVDGLGVAKFSWSPLLNTFQMADSGGFGGASSFNLLDITLSDAGKLTAINVLHNGLNATLSVVNARNLSNGALARTVVTCLNDQSRSCFIGVGSSGNSIYPNTAFLESGGNADHLNIHAGGVAGFITFGTGTSGLAGEKMRLTSSGILLINATAAVGTARLQVNGSIRTGNPGLGQGAWLLGQRQAAAVAFDNTQYLEVNVDGVVYRVALAV